jgi:hypothetical protein
MKPMNDEVLKALIRMAIAGDMNAAHAVENEIELRGLKDGYCISLVAEIDFDGALCDPSVNYDLLFLLIHATAAQRAQAALKVLELEL